jgi:hypothetical protein
VSCTHIHTHTLTHTHSLSLSLSLLLNVRRRWVDTLTESLAVPAASLGTLNEEEGEANC